MQLRYAPFTVTVAAWPGALTRTASDSAALQSVVALSWASALCPACSVTSRAGSAVCFAGFPSVAPARNSCAAGKPCRVQVLADWLTKMSPAICVCGSAPPRCSEMASWPNVQANEFGGGADEDDDADEDGSEDELEVTGADDGELDGTSLDDDAELAGAEELDAVEPAPSVDVEDVHPETNPASASTAMPAARSLIGRFADRSSTAGC